jgi:hypothetical protein
MQGMQLLRPAQGRPNGQGRPLYNRVHRQFLPLIALREFDEFFGTGL